MLFENHAEALHVLPPDVGVLHRASPRQLAHRPHEADAGARPLLRPHAPTALSSQHPLPRCRQKGCVFPAQPGGDECADHRRRSLEPAYFQSQQPTFLLLDQARFGLPDSEPDDSRVKDRQRLAAERVRFLLEDAA